MGRFRLDIDQWRRPVEPGVLCDEPMAWNKHTKEPYYWCSHHVKPGETKCGQHLRKHQRAAERAAEQAHRAELFAFAQSRSQIPGALQGRKVVIDCDELFDWFERIDIKPLVEGSWLLQGSD